MKNEQIFHLSEQFRPITQELNSAILIEFFFGFSDFHNFLTVYYLRIWQAGINEKQ